MMLPDLRIKKFNDKLEDVVEKGYKPTGRNELQTYR